MRNRLLILAFALLAVLTSVAEEWQPLADDNAIVKSGKARFTVLTDRMIRIEYSSTLGQWEDRATFAVVNRRLPVPHYETWEDGGYLYIRTDSLELQYKVGSILKNGVVNTTALRITLRMGGKDVLWYPGKDDAMNLLGTSRTLDGNIGDTHRVKLEHGLLSRAGWAILDESPSATRGDGSTTFPFENTVDGIPWVGKKAASTNVDWYFMGYGHQYEDALRDYVKIGGRMPMPPKWMFGYWYSKYQAYSQSEFQQLVKDMETNRLPHDVLMLDMDWHQSGWTGWTWNKSLITSPTTLLNYMHTHKVKTALNLHPADGIGKNDQNFSKMCADLGLTASTTDRIPWQLEDSTFYRTFFTNIMRVREKEGVDFWWLDWQQDLTSSYIKGLSQTFWLNHVYYNDMKQKRPDRRPVIFHRWGGMGCHRYPLGFSGDTFATWGTLQFESYFTATAANVCFGYWGHDGGGYLQPAERKTDPELVLRWMQFCAFQPIFRTHGSSQSSCERRVWKFSNLNLQREAFELRYALVPYIYTAARKAYDTGVSICRPLYYTWPEENKAYSTEDEYMFGDDILAAPIATESQYDGTSRRRTWLPPGMWYDVTRGTMREGGEEIEDNYALNEIPYFIRQGSIIPTQSAVQTLKDDPERIVLWVVPGETGKGDLYEDEGDSQTYEDGIFATTHFNQTGEPGLLTLEIGARQGSYTGMKSERTYEVVVYSMDKPHEVLLNGTTLGGWTYDEVRRTLNIVLPTQDARKALILQLITDPDGTSQHEDAGKMSLTYQAASGRIEANTSATAKRFSIILTDMAGREVLRKEATNVSRMTLNANTLPDGEYVCWANADGQTLTRKIIKL